MEKVLLATLFISINVREHVCDFSAWTTESAEYYEGNWMCAHACTHTHMAWDNGLRSDSWFRIKTVNRKHGLEASEIEVKANPYITENVMLPHITPK